METTESPHPNNAYIDWFLVHRLKLVHAAMKTGRICRIMLNSDSDGPDPRHKQYSHNPDENAQRDTEPQIIR